MGNRPIASGHIVSYKEIKNFEENNPSYGVVSLRYQLATSMSVKKDTPIYTTMRTGNNPTGAGTRKLFMVLRPYHKKEKD